MDYIDYLIKKEIQEDANKYAESLYPQYKNYSKIAADGYIVGYNIKKRQTIIGILRLSIIVLFLIATISFFNWL